MAFKNLNILKNKMKNRSKDSVKKAKRAVFRSANIVQGYAQDNINRGAKTGNPRPQGGTASAAGEFPATDTGFLVSNISTNVITDRGAVIGQVISAAPYSKHLEYGTTKMGARPFMQPSLRANRKKIQDIFKKEGVIDK